MPFRLVNQPVGPLRKKVIPVPQAYEKSAGAPQPPAAASSAGTAHGGTAQSPFTATAPTKSPTGRPAVSNHEVSAPQARPLQAKLGAKGRRPTTSTVFAPPERQTGQDAAVTPTTQQQAVQTGHKAR